MLKLIAFVALFVGFCWFGTTVQLGSRTLFAHLRAIGQTKESQELFEATRQSAKPLVDNVRRRIAGVPDPKETSPTRVPAAARVPDGGAPEEIVTPGERRRLRKLLSAADHTAARP